MPVWFAYRCFDFGPTGKHLRRFEDDTVLAWFRRNWDHLCVADIEEADRRLADVLRCDGWILSSPFIRAAETGRARPTTHADLLDFIRASFPDETVSASPHVLQIYTEEDGEGGADYFFDGHFLKKSPGLASYLLHEDWRLPSGHGDGGYAPAVETMKIELGWGGLGATYLAMLIRESKYPLDDLPVGYRIEGVRLPDLAGHMCRVSRAGWHGQLQSLPTLMLAGVEAADRMENVFLRAIQADPGDAVNWGAWSDWRQDHGQEPPGITLLRDAFARRARLPGGVQDDVPGWGWDDLGAACRELLALEGGVKLRTAPKSLIHVEEHLAQICLDTSATEHPRFEQWIFFDDLWASAHRDLANAILRFAARWDVLSTD